jgi:glucan phosphoethanolaminetransferase (alkaline phosphatase superfamily)
MNLTRFKILLLIPFIYISFSSILISGMFESLVAIAETDIIIFVLIGLHLFSMFCAFYCLYFNAKALKTVESQQLVTFSDFIGEFFVIWFFPIGIWILQPRINKLFDKTITLDKN